MPRVLLRGWEGGHRPSTLSTLRPCYHVSGKSCVLPEGQGELRNYLKILARGRTLNTLPECLSEGKIYFSIRNFHTNTLGMRGWGPAGAPPRQFSPQLLRGAFRAWRLRPPPLHAHAGWQWFPFLMPAPPFHHNEDSKWGDGRRGEGAPRVTLG